MQPYRFVTGEAVPGRPAGGHHLCQQDTCAEVAESQHRRHATDEEYAALPEGLVPIDGVCHMAVFTCGDHEMDPLCRPEHHFTEQPATVDPADAACRKCDAEPGAACVKADGRSRARFHTVRSPAAPQPQPVRCDHVHRADCEGLGACQCSPDDPVPERPGTAAGTFAGRTP